MEIPKNPYACANCHKRFNNPIILIKHVELRHSIAKKSQNDNWNTAPKKNYASIENRDSPRTINTSLVPFEFTPITTDIEMIFPQEIEAPMKDQSEEIMDQDNNSEVVSVQDIDKHSFLLRSIKNENSSKIDVGKLLQEIEVPINDQIDQERNSETHSISRTKTGNEKNSFLASTENETMSITNLHKPSNSSIISIQKSNEHKSVHREDKRNLNLMVVHGGKKQFQCDFCEYTYATKQNLRRHILVVHEGKKPFKCEICDYSFSRKSAMKTHVASVHIEKKL